MMKLYQHFLNLYRRHKAGFWLSFLLSVTLIIIAVLEASLLKTVTYLTVMFVAFLLSEFNYHIVRPKLSVWEIKKPKQELKVIIFVVLIASALMVFRFMLIEPDKISQFTRTITFFLRILFVFPILLLIFFLGIKRYKPHQIGIGNFRYWYLSIPILFMIGGTTLMLFPEGVQFKQKWQAVGFSGFITFGFLTAAIPEEITRTLFQSRLGAVMNSKVAAWFIVSLVWALQHIPTFVYKTNGDYYGATISALGILPIGLFWGYLNERYKSIIPSVILHGTNLWGLHNIF